MDVAVVISAKLLLPCRLAAETAEWLRYNDVRMVNGPGTLRCHMLDVLYQMSEGEHGDDLHATIKEWEEDPTP